MSKNDKIIKDDFFNPKYDYKKPSNQPDPKKVAKYNGGKSSKKK